MADASHSELVAQFTGVTGVDADRAKFYLESAAWKLEVALASFYEDDDGGDIEVVGGNPGMETSPSRDPDPSQPPAPAKSSQPKPQSRFATIANIQDSGSSDEEQGEAYYAGGSEHGAGQQVLGPPRKKQNADELVQNMFKAAREHGAEVVEPGTSSQSKGKPTFRGTGYRLGDTEGASVTVPGFPVEMAPKEIDVVLKLWKNGFSVTDGPLRDYRDPANKEFLDSIHKGEVPRELLRLAKGGEINLNMEDHRAEDYVKPKVSTKAFTGEGHTLGSVAPSVAPSAASGAAASPSQSAPAASVEVDSSKPTTQLQIRLADGSRMVSKFNHSHTIADIRNYIISAHPQFASSNFILMTTFPNKELTDETQTLEDAKLLNAVLVQRIK